MAHPNNSFLWRAHRFSVWFGGAYAFLLIMLTIPYLQRHIIYLHALRIPLWADYNQPHLYGLAPFRATNFNLTTPDNICIGAWFVLAEASYSIPARPADEATITNAISSHPTILFFHGTAGSRASVLRPKIYGLYSTRINANIMTIDYRGFGDSEGTPSESGLITDARAAFEWLVKHGAKAQDIILMGQSLGTGVAAGLAAQLSAEGVEPRGVALVAGFTSFPRMLEDYQMFGMLPILRPLKAIPFFTKLLFRFLWTHFDTETALSSVRAPIVLVHALNDADIPHVQSISLFEGLLEALLTPIPKELSPALGIGLSADQIKQVHALGVKRSEERALMVTQTDLVFASAQTFDRGNNWGNVSLLLPISGQHNEVVLAEGVVDFIAQFLRIPRRGS